MSRILVTHPGKFGDVLWALPTVRAISEAHGEPVDFATSVQYSDDSFRRLINKQPYVDIAFHIPGWMVYDTAPMTPREPTPELLAKSYERVYHLGYEAWPKYYCALDVYLRALALNSSLSALDDSPWVTLGPSDRSSNTILVCWSQEWIELKMGLTLAVAAKFPEVQFKILCPRRQCRQEEWLWVLPDNCCLVHGDWLEACRWMEQATFYLGCLSGSWVLANATGTPVVAVEPAEARHHPVFWRDSPINHMTIGGDLKPTFDARHTCDMVKLALERYGK